MNEEAGAERRRSSWKAAVVVLVGLVAAVAMLLRLHELGPRLAITSHVILDAPSECLHGLQITVRGGSDIERIEVVPEGAETIVGRTAVEDFASGSVFSTRVLVPRDAEGRADGAVMVRQRGLVDRDYRVPLGEGPSGPEAPR